MIKIILISLMLLTQSVMASDFHTKESLLGLFGITEAEAINRNKGMGYANLTVCVLLDDSVITKADPVRWQDSINIYYGSLNASTIAYDISTSEIQIDIDGFAEDVNNIVGSIYLSTNALVTLDGEVFDTKYCVYSNRLILEGR